MKLVFEELSEELVKIKKAVGEQAYECGRYAEAARLFKNLIDQECFVEFFTLPKYDSMIC